VAAIRYKGAMSSSHRWVLASGFVVGLASAVVGCKGSGNGTGAGGAGGAPTPSGEAGEGGGAVAGGDGAVAFSKSELLGAFGSCAAKGAHDFQARAAALDAALATLVAAPDDANKAAARDAFKQAMASWQVMDMLQYGPTGSNATVAGGKDFRDNIYAWPTFGRCAIDEALVAKSYEANFGALLANRRGMAAVEYLLFYEGADTACTSGSGWTSLSADERAARKRAYAAAAAHDVATRAAGLDAAWDPAKMNFVQTMRTAGSGNAVYPTVQAAIESVGLAIFYLDRMVKDQKLGTPINDSCTAASCFESSYGGLSTANIRANLDGLRRVLEGCEADHAGLGFDDLLVNIGSGALADTLRAQAIAAQAAAAAITEPTIDQALAQNPTAVDALRAALGELTTTIKTSLYTTLNFEPALIPTDNDA
jgi:predicted lipoprotein